MIRSLLSLYLLFLLFAGNDPSAAAPPASPTLIDDRAITVQGRADIESKRRALIRYLWGPAGFPTRRMPDTVRTNVAPPVQHLGNLARVDELQVDQMPGLQGLAYHFVPLGANRELVVVHHGHGCTLDDDSSTAEVGYGLQRTIAALLDNGYGVLGVFMPHMRPNDCTNGHDALCRVNDLYILGAHGKGRKQVQILNRRDDCCFGEAQYEAKGSGVRYTDAVLEYAQRVRATLEQLGPGSFQLQIDEVAPSHMISHHAIEQFILPELPKARRP